MRIDGPLGRASSPALPGRPGGRPLHASGALPEDVGFLQGQELAVEVTEGRPVLTTV